MGHLCKDWERIKKEWKSFCDGDDELLISSFQSLLQTNEFSILKTPDEIKEIFKNKLLDSNSTACGCKDLQNTPASTSNRKRLCELICPSHKWKVNDIQLIDILENYEYSGTFHAIQNR